MKKYLVLLVCCVMLALVGCGNKKFVGEWEVTSATMAGEEMPAEMLAAAPKLVINKDGTAETAGEKFTWEADGDVITFFIDGKEYQKAELKDGKLVISEEKQGVKMEMTYSKK